MNTSPGTDGIERNADGYVLVGPDDQVVPQIIEDQASVLNSVNGFADEYGAAANQLVNSSYSMPELQFSSGDGNSPQGSTDVAIANNGAANDNFVRSVLIATQIVDPSRNVRVVTPVPFGAVFNLPPGFLAWLLYKAPSEGEQPTE